MADDMLDTKEALAAKHKLEKKELQAKIQALKKGIPKGDKKKNKEVKAQITILENELNVKHDKEIADLEKENVPVDKTQETQPSQNGFLENSQPRVSKAQKKRDKKALKMKEQAKIAAEAEEDYVNTLRYAEEEKIKKLLSAMKLEVKTVVSDGNCMYYAIEDQLKTSDRPIYNCNELRKFTSEYMLSHADDFMPFLTEPVSGDCYSSEGFKNYCQEIAETSAWGGQLELRALSHVLKMPIHVIQADIPTVIIGEEYKTKPIILTYHRHELGLGEHYNSVQPLAENNEYERL